MSDSIIPAPGEHLTDGWEPDLRADDTLVRQAVLAHAAWPEEAGRAAGRPWRSEAGWSGARISDRGALANPVILRQPLRDPSTVFAEIESLFPPRVPYVLLSPWPTVDLREHGLVLLGHPPLMVRFPAEAPAASPTRGIELREVRDADELATAERILVEGYPLADLQPVQPGELFGATVLGGSLRFWLAWLDGSPVAVAAAQLHAGVTLVEYVATLPQARGRGAGSAVTWAATLADPSRPAMLLASDDGRPVYERMGYVAIERWTAWLRPPGGSETGG